MNHDVKSADAFVSPGDEHPMSARIPIRSAQATHHDVWVINRWWDLLLLVAPPLLLIPLAELLGASESIGQLSLVVLTIGAVGHHLPGFLRAYGDRQLWCLYRTRLLLAPPVMLAIGLFFSFAGLSSLTLVLLVWGFWHVMMQEYGLARLYDSKVESLAAWTRRLDFLMCFCWFALAVLVSPTRLEQLLRHWYYAGGPLLHPAVVQLAQMLWVAVSIFVSVWFVGNYFYQHRRGEAASLVKLLALASSVGLWWFTMVSVHDLLLGLLLYELFHAVQSLALVRSATCRLGGGAGTTVPWARWLFRPGLLRLAVFLALAALYGVPAYFAGATPLWTQYSSSSGWLLLTLFGLVAASTLLHYYYEGFLWQLRDIHIRSSLGIAESPRGVAGRGAGVFVPHTGKWGVLVVVLTLLATCQWRSAGPTPGGYENLTRLFPRSWQARADYGAQLIADGHWTAAVEELRRATSMNPQLPKTLCDLSRALRELGRWEDAVEQSGRAMLMAPGDATALAEHGNALLGLRLIDAALFHLQTARRIRPTDEQIAYDLGRALVVRGEERDMRSALQLFDDVLAHRPEWAEAYNARGGVYWKTDDLDKALADFDRAIACNPRLAQAYRNRAGVWQQRGDFSRALYNLDQAITVDSTRALDYVWRGEIYCALERYDQARDNFMEGVRRETTYIEPLESLIELLTACPDPTYRDPSQAIAWAQAACQRTGWSDAGSVRLLAAAYAAAGDWDQAIHWQKIAVDIVSAEKRESWQIQLEEYQRQQAGAGKPLEASTTWQQGRSSSAAPVVPRSTQAAEKAD